MTGLKDAASAVRRGELVVLPTDTVYGIGADAFSPSAVQALLDAKGRGRDMPVPVLVGSVRAATALVETLTPYGQDLVEEFWPGALTIICRHTSTLNWDLGESRGTVAVRMPLHQVALDLLKETGPMAVSSANKSGAPPASTCGEAEEQLGDAIAVYLDNGRCGVPVPSSIVDLTGSVPRLLREGAISAERLREVLHFLVTDEDTSATGAGNAPEAGRRATSKAASSAGDSPAPKDAPAASADEAPASGSAGETPTGASSDGSSDGFPTGSGNDSSDGSPTGSGNGSSDGGGGES